MDEKQTLFASLSRDPMLAVEAGRIIYSNEALRALMPELRPGAPAEELLPEAILGSGADRIHATVALGGHEYGALAVRTGADSLAVALTPLYGERGAFLSDGALGGMKSMLFNIELAAGAINDELPEGPGFALAREYLAAMRHSYYALSRQLANLETAMLLEEGASFLCVEKTDLVELCDSLVSTVALLTDGQSAGLEFQTELETLNACVDGTRVERLLLNLLSNSLHATPKDGHIRVTLSRAGENAVISVDDTGGGIPEDVMQNLFVRYGQRVNPDHPRKLGAGLGLTVARGIAEAHGGALVLESREGKGTAARVSLPLERCSALLESPRSEPNRAGMPLILSELTETIGLGFYDLDYI